MRDMFLRRRLTPTTLRRTAAMACIGALVGLAACSGTEAADPDFTDGKGISATVLPQIAAPGEEPEAANDADYVVDATIEGAEEGREVELQVADGDDWEIADTAETDAEGRVSLRVAKTGDLRVVADGDTPVGIELSTDDAPKETFVDEFDAKNKDWATRDQGYAGVRMCSKASDDAREWVDGVLRLSVIDDPDREKCRYKKKQYDYRLNGHLGSAYTFVYGHAAARIKFQDLRGQHGSFWLQGLGLTPTGDPKETGAEIDVIEFFGNDHPEGGLTSFVYWQPKKGSKTAGGWVKNPEQYGDDWSSKFHVFSVEWTPEKYVFRIDGQVTNTITEGISGRPEFLVLSLLSSDYELQHLKGDKLPQHMDVDWARVWAEPTP